MDWIKTIQEVCVVCVCVRACMLCVCVCVCACVHVVCVCVCAYVPVCMCDYTFEAYVYAMTVFLCVHDIVRVCLYPCPVGDS